MPSKPLAADRGHQTEPPRVLEGRLRRLVEWIGDRRNRRELGGEVVEARVVHGRGEERDGAEPRYNYRSSMVTLPPALQNNPDGVTRVVHPLAPL